MTGSAPCAPRRSASCSANVERGVLRLMRLIDNLLESVRIEAGQLSIRQQPVDLREVVGDARDLIAPLLRQRALTAGRTRRLRAWSAIVRGDAQRLGQVFVNLLANAAKFAPEGSTIRIGGRRRRRRRSRCGSRMRVRACRAGSTGAIFERFQRGADTEPDAPGLGLGPLDRQVDHRASRRHGARRAHRRAAHALHGHTAAERQRRAASRGEPERVKLLVVDDDADMLAVVSFALRQAGFPVVTRATATAPD